MRLKENDIVKKLDVGLNRYSDSNITNGTWYSNIGIDEYLDLHSLLSDLINRYAPTDSIYRINFLDIYKSRKLSDKEKLNADIQSLSGILLALRGAYNNNLLQSIEEQVHGEIFNDFLEMAEFFLTQGDQYKHPAAFLIGGVLEEHLRKLSKKFEIQIMKDTDHYRHAEDLNMDLRKKGVYNDNERKSITAWLGLRNDVDHAHWTNISLEKVDIMLKDVRRIINQYPA